MIFHNILSLCSLHFKHQDKGNKIALFRGEKGQFMNDFIANYMRIIDKHNVLS